MSNNNSVALYIKQLLMNTANSIKIAEMIIIEGKLQYSGKDRMNGIIKRLRGVEKDIYLQVDPEQAKVIKDEVLENWESLSFQNITTMMASMDDNQRRILEECAGHILAGTFKVEEE